MNDTADPTGPTDTADRGWRSYRAGDYDAARALFDRAIADDPNDYSAHLGRGRCHRLLGDHGGATADFSVAHELRPDAARPLFERGAVALLEHRYHAALVDYQRAAAREPAYPGGASYFAELYLYTGRSAEALAVSQRARRDEPTNLVHRVNIAHAYLLLGETNRARRAYAAVAHQVDPGKRVTGGEIALTDIQLLRSAGIDPPGISGIERQLRDTLTRST